MTGWPPEGQVCSAPAAPAPRPRGICRTGAPIMTAACCVWGALQGTQHQDVAGCEPQHVPRTWVSFSGPFNRRETEAGVAPARPPEGRGLALLAPRRGGRWAAAEGRGALCLRAALGSTPLPPKEPGSPVEPSPCEGPPFPRIRCPARGTFTGVATWLTECRGAGVGGAGPRSMARPALYFRFAFKNLQQPSKE